MLFYLRNTNKMPLDSRLPCLPSLMHVKGMYLQRIFRKPRSIARAVFHQPFFPLSHSRQSFKAPSNTLSYPKPMRPNTIAKHSMRVMVNVMRQVNRARYPSSDCYRSCCWVTVSLRRVQRCLRTWRRFMSNDCVAGARVEEY